MKLFWCCVAAVLLAITSAAVDVEKTVQQVQSILKANALLPRLTRAEIIDLLNDIREEDAKSKPVSGQKTTITKQKPVEVTTIPHSNERDNEINTSSKLSESVNVSVNGKYGFKPVESTTKSSGATLTVVLPYTPRDGSSLQELYTRPPRLQLVPEEVTPKPVKPSKSGTKVDQTVKNHGKGPNKQKFDFPAELQAFLDAHGLKGKPGQDNFLLPLDGFKPLPPAKIVDGNVQLPENLLLTYDLISPSDLTKSSTKDQDLAQTNFLYEPLRPEIPFELDTSSSESKHTVLPLDLPKPRKTKAIQEPRKPNYEPIDYDSIKVIPLPQGPNPVEDEVILNANPDQNKRQTNETSAPDSESTTTTESTNTESDAKDSAAIEPDVVASDADAGASIADLEDSFGGAVPAEPGDSELPPPRKNGFYWMVDWNSFLEVGDGDTKVNIRFEPKLGDPQMFLPVNVP
ncbi:uncharacterized protein [Maniola hyperantus]|uniref:uncharacterized protein n=1 Tax=Aphantopus hyperantus TaxID=2795564 RepID=UPI001568E4D5|nr:uncharacterized protein LOC117989399 [Maniola hyperantus]XP_034832647.1 uncharacterized protein LOC117989399 [Maniola hyperantus]